MATSILPGGHSHFDQGSQFYPQHVYQDFSHDNPGLSNPQSQYSIPTTQDESLSLTSSQSWPAQLGSRRASKSPNAPERTPIRHSRGNLSRTRSTSGSGALYAYEQSLQQQQQQQHQHQHQQQQSLATPPLIQQTTPISSPSLFTSQAFSSMPPSPPFMQQGYYDNSAAAFTDLPSSHVGHPLSDYYSLGRNDIHPATMNTTSLAQQDALYMHSAGQPRPQTLPSMSAQALNFPPIPRPLESTTATNVEVSSSRNKPQCWDHGCNGRQFSTFSNLLRHQREKSGTAAKARCPHCGTEFTRTTARNGHMYGGKCKGMPDATKRLSISESMDNSE